MKYKDYYAILNIDRSATIDDIKKSYRKLAHLYHPDVSSDPQGEEKFKEIAEAYATLKNPEKRQAYDSIGQREKDEDFAAPPEWQQNYGASAADFDDVDLADLLKNFRSQSYAHPGEKHPIKGEDYAVTVPVSLEKMYEGGETDVTVELLEYDANGLPHRVPRTFRVTIPKGAGEGQRLRLIGKGAPGHQGGQHGDLYIILTIMPHPIFRMSGNDLYFDLLLTPWEAVLGSKITIPTLGGNIELTIKPGTFARQQLRIAGRGLPAAKGKSGDLYAVVQIAVPKTINSHEQKLYEELASASDFKPRAYVNEGAP